MANILILDDDASNLQLLRLVLEENNHQVTEARDGLQGLAQIRRQQPDLVITDILMPELDGLGLLRALRHEFPRLPTIAMTGGSTALPGTTLLRLADGLGADEILRKPFGETELLLAIDKVLGADSNAPRA